MRIADFGLTRSADLALRAAKGCLHSAAALSVPLGALDDEGRGPGVWLLDRQSSSVSYRSVNFIRFDGEHAIVSGGIHIGDPIIAVGGHFLREGERVQVAEARVARD